MYQLTKQAEKDISEIYIYGCEIFGTKRAERYLFELEEKFELLNKNPDIAKERLEFIPPVRIYPYISHLIVYTRIENNIFIIRVLHNKQNWEQYFS